MKLFIFLIVGLIFGPSFLKLSLPVGTPTLVTICTYGFLFVAGLELSLKATRQNFSKAVRLSFGAFIPPFIVGVLTALYILNDTEFSTNTVLFLAIALSISALPVAIQILKDLNLYKTELGNLIISVATLCDIIAWVAFAFILPSEGMGPWISSHISVFLFFVGLALSDASILSARVRRSLEVASRWFFGPVFFISIGWKLNLWQHFALAQVLVVFVTATVSKYAGCYFTAKSLGFSRKKSILVGLSLNARGAVEIVIATLALQQNLINPTLFTTLVVMAIATSLLPEPLTHLLKLKED